MNYNWDKILEVILLFVPDYKIARSVLNKFKNKVGQKVDSEFHPVGEYHWDLAKIKLKDDDYIGWYDGVSRYYQGVVKFDIYNLELEVDEKLSMTLRSQMVTANKILDELRGGTDA